MARYNRIKSNEIYNMKSWSKSLNYGIIFAKIFFIVLFIALVAIKSYPVQAGSRDDFYDNYERLDRYGREYYSRKPGSDMHSIMDSRSYTVIRYQNSNKRYGDSRANNRIYESNYVDEDYGGRDWRYSYSRYKDDRYGSGRYYSYTYREPLSDRYGRSYSNRAEIRGSKFVRSDYGKAYSSNSYSGSYVRSAYGSGSSTNSGARYVKVGTVGYGDPEDRDYYIRGTRPGSVSYEKDLYPVRSSSVDSENYAKVYKINKNGYRYDSYPFN